jgi:hypothetical protein
MEVVCSENSGMADFIHSAHSYPIRTHHMESAAIKGQGFGDEYVYRFGDVGEWWVPDEDHATKQLSKCFDNWLSGRGKGRAAADYVRAHHTLGQQAASVLKVLERYE